MEPEKSKGIDLSALLQSASSLSVLQKPSGSSKILGMRTLASDTLRATNPSPAEPIPPEPFAPTNAPVTPPKEKLKRPMFVPKVPVQPKPPVVQAIQHSPLEEPKLRPSSSALPSAPSVRPSVSPPPAAGPAVVRAKGSDEGFLDFVLKHEIEEIKRSGNAPIPVVVPPPVRPVEKPRAPAPIPQIPKAAEPAPLPPRPGPVSPPPSSRPVSVQSSAAPISPVRTSAPSSAPVQPATPARPMNNMNVAPPTPAPVAFKPVLSSRAPAAAGPGVRVLQGLPITPTHTPASAPAMKVDTFSFPKMSSATANPPTSAGNTSTPSQGKPAPVNPVAEASKPPRKPIVVPKKPVAAAPAPSVLPSTPAPGVATPAQVIPPPAPQPTPQPVAVMGGQPISQAAAQPSTPSVVPPVSIDALPDITPLLGTDPKTIASIPDEIATLEAEVKKIETDRRVVEGRTAKLFQDRVAIEAELAPVLERVSAAEAALAIAEEEEHRAMSGDAEARRNAEAKRYACVEEKHAKDEEKWGMKARLEAVLAQIASEQAVYTELGKRERRIDDRIHTLEAEAERRRLSSDLAKIGAERGTAESKVNELIAERARVDLLLKELVTKEAAIESQVAATNSGKANRSVTEEKAIAEARYRLEKERHDVEMERWKVEDAVASLHGTVADSEHALASVRAKEAEIATKLSQLG